MSDYDDWKCTEPEDLSLDDGRHRRPRRLNNYEIVGAIRNQELREQEGIDHEALRTNGTMARATR